MTDSIETSCPYCGAPVEILIDEGGGPQQAYVEDCSVCCRPWQVEVTWMSDGGWTATLQTLDE